MAKLSDHQSGQFTKIMLIGDSGTGKTGALASLVPEYDLRILDFDNGLDILKAFVKRDNPDRLSSIDFETVRDGFKASKTLGATVTSPKAYTEAAKLLTEWSDGSIPGNWGPKTIFVLDSLTTMGKSAYEWARVLNQQANNNDQRAWYKTAQDALENVVAMITSDAFETNVIIISHVTYNDADGLPRGYPSTIGKALGPKIGRYLNNIVLAESSGSGEKVKRTIRIVPNDLIDLKTAAPFAFEGKSLPLETGLAELFRALKSN